MIERIKQLRKALGLNQGEFAKSLNVAQSTITAYETGNRQITDRTISDICTKYNVSEKWLRTGEGEMFRSLSRDKEIAAFFGSVLAASDTDNDRENELKKRILQLLARMTPKQWEALAGIAESWAELNKNEGQD